MINWIGLKIQNYLAISKLITEMGHWSSNYCKIIKFIFIRFGLTIQIPGKIKIIYIKKWETVWLRENFFSCGHWLFRNLNRDYIFLFYVYIYVSLTGFMSLIFFLFLFLFVKSTSIKLLKSVSANRNIKTLLKFLNNQCPQEKKFSLTKHSLSF